MSWTPYPPSNHHEADAETKAPWPGRRLLSDSIGMDVDEGYALVGDSSEEHFFFLQNDAGSVQLSPGSSFAPGTLEGPMMGASAVWSMRRVSNGSENRWSNALDSLPLTSSTVDEDPFAISDNEDDALPQQSISRSFYEETGNQSDTQQALDISSDTYVNVSAQSWNTFFLQPTVESTAYNSGRRHSDSQPFRPSQRPVLHRSHPSDSFLAMDMQKLHVGEGIKTQSTSPSPSSTVSAFSPSGYPSPASIDEASLLQIPTIERTVMRRYSDSAGQRSTQVSGMLHHSQSESFLRAHSNDVTATRSPMVQGSSSSLSNALLEPEYRTSISSGRSSILCPVPPHAESILVLPTVAPSSTAMSSDARGPPSSPGVAWHTQMYPPIQTNPSIFAAGANNSLPITRERGAQGSESGYQYCKAPSSYTTSHDSVAPSGTSENYNLVDGNDLHLHVDTQNLTGYQTLTALSSAQTYDRGYLSTPQNSVEQNALDIILRGDASPPIFYVGGLCVPSESASMSAAPTMPVPHVTPPDPENAVAGPSTVVHRMGSRQTRGTRKPDPRAQQKMRKVNAQARYFCTECSLPGGYTIKSALVRHMRDKHGSGPLPTCHVCGKFYRDQTSVQRHWRDRHGPNAKVTKPRRKHRQR